MRITAAKESAGESFFKPGQGQLVHPRRERDEAIQFFGEVSFIDFITGNQS